MSHRLHRVAARFLAIGLLAATLFTVDLLASPTPAEARCTGVNNMVISTFKYPHVAASETPVYGTCNGNQLYTGILMDEAADGFCVSVEFMEAGYAWNRASPILCGNGRTARFEWRDINDNSRAYERFCLHRASDKIVFACGWGDNTGTYGTNWGY